MEWYLTGKALSRRKRDIPLFILSLILSVIAIDVCVKNPGSDDAVIDILASLIVIGLCLLPLFFVVKHWVRQWAARRLAASFAKCQDSVIPFSQLTPRARQWIRVLTSKGFLQNVYISSEKQRVTLDRPQDHAVTGPDPARQSQEDTIRRIRALNDDIQNEAVSRQIDRIEAVTASIFSTVRERPERSGDARKFMNYYLPTTLKLLESYRLMEGQTYQGQNVQTARASIENALAKLTEAIERQQDRLYLPEAMDVESDIRVIETMMAADGLNREKIEIHV